MKKSNHKKRLIAGIAGWMAAFQCLSASAILPIAAEETEEVQAPMQASDTQAANQFGFDDNILISAFYPPSEAYINDEQYRYLAEAGIKSLMGAGNGVGSEENQRKMLELCEKYGIQLTVGANELADVLLSGSEEKIIREAMKYQSYAATSGFYLMDEPYIPNEYITAYKALKQINPDYYLHLNFLPYASYPDLDMYRNVMNEWCCLCAEAGYPTEYLMYDLYPFSYNGDMNKVGFYTNLETIRQVGLLNNVKTAAYVQSSGIKYAMRSPNETELRFEINMFLAFGIKQLSYFTWFTPNWPDSEPYYGCIVSPDGVRNESYYWISEINKDVERIGKTLVKCDALEVYASRSDTPEISKVPEDYMFSFGNRKRFIASYLRDRESGRNYIMVVNQSYEEAQKLMMTFDSAITSLEYLSYDTGLLEPMALDENNGITLMVEAGDAIIFALPEDYDYETVRPKTPAPAPGTNLALDGHMSCSSSSGQDGMYIANLNDGRDSAEDKPWQSVGDDPARITLDLGRVTDFNRIELYPAGAGVRYGTNMPSDFTVSVSENGEDWRIIATVSEYEAEKNQIPVLEFDPVSARYMRIQVTQSNRSVVELTEIKVFHNDGSVTLEDGRQPHEGWTVVYTTSDAETEPETAPTTDTATETSPVADTESETEGESTASSLPEHEASETTGDTENGCTSVIGLGGIVLWTAVSIGVCVLRRKRKEA